MYLRVTILILLILYPYSFTARFDDVCRFPLRTLYIDGSLRSHFVRCQRAFNDRIPHCWIRVNPAVHKSHRSLGRRSAVFCRPSKPAIDNDSSHTVCHRVDYKVFIILFSQAFLPTTTVTYVCHTLCHIHVALRTRNNNLERKIIK